MTDFATSEEWLHQSTLLVRACPTVSRVQLGHPQADQQTRITTKYEIQKADDPRARLEFKSYDPATGACLKYKTDKAAEVGRLVAALGRLAGEMAGVPESAATTTEATTEAPPTPAEPVKKKKKSRK